MEMENVLAALAALAQHSRLEVFRTLITAGAGGLAAGVIAERLKITPATLSFHLAQLSHAKLVRSVRQGRSIIYYADFETMGEVIAYLTENCCGGAPCPPLCP